MRIFSLFHSIFSPENLRKSLKSQKTCDFRPKMIIFENRSLQKMTFRWIFGQKSSVICILGLIWLKMNFYFENDWNKNAYFYRIRWKRFVFVCELDDSVRYLSDRLFKCKFRTGRVLKSMGRLIVVNAKTETIIFYELEVLNQCKNIKMSKHTHPYCILLFHSNYFLPSFTLHMIFMFRTIHVSKTTICKKS